jgi:hypothetical protein
MVSLLDLGCANLILHFIASQALGEITNARYKRRWRLIYEQRRSGHRPIFAHVVGTGQVRYRHNTKIHSGAGRIRRETCQRNGNSVYGYGGSASASRRVAGLVRIADDDSHPDLRSAIDQDGPALLVLERPIYRVRSWRRRCGQGDRDVDRATRQRFLRKVDLRRAAKSLILICRIQYECICCVPGNVPRIFDFECFNEFLPGLQNRVIGIIFVHERGLTRCGSLIGLGWRNRWRRYEENSIEPILELTFRT